MLLARTSGGEQPELVEPLLDIREGVEQLTGLARTLRDFGAPIARPALLDLGDVLDTVVRMVRARLQRTARLERHYHQVPPVHAIEPQLRHALLNLVLNAIEAFERQDPDRNYVRLEVALDAEQRAVVTVENNGKPIRPDELELVFMQFYTTKEHGTGIGLALCRRVVEALGGNIAVRSDAERTAFVVTLPTTTE
jgi:signal transduction histidine kinase